VKSQQKIQSLTCGVVLRTVVEDCFLEGELRHLKSDVDVDWRLQPGEIQRIHRVPDCKNICHNVYVTFLEMLRGTNAFRKRTFLYLQLSMMQLIYMAYTEFEGGFCLDMETPNLQFIICSNLIHTQIQLSHETA